MTTVIQEFALCFSFWVLVVHFATGFMAPQGMLVASPRSVLQRCNSPWTRTLASAKGDEELNWAGFNKEIAQLQEEIRAVQQDIKSVDQEIKRIDAAIDQGSTFMGISDPMRLFDKGKQLREEKNLLIVDMDKIREKENLLIAREDQLQALTIEEKLNSTVPVYSTEYQTEELVAFHNRLADATVANDTLQLPDGVSFLGDKRLGNKLFIRQCYRDLQGIIFDGAEIGTLDKIVVTGTPGIGKSVFNFYLLYLLRLQGKTVLFNSRENWYRFSDEGVERNRFFNLPMKYFRDKNSWFLCDPKNKPTASFSGITVVTVSSEEERTKEFLKMANSKKFYMPPWSLEELEKCRRLQYPEVSEMEVEATFDLIGGVARPIFNRNTLEDYFKDMRLKAGKFSDEELQLIRRSGISGDVSAKISNKLVHTFPVPRSGYSEYTLRYASEKAEALITWIQTMKDVDGLIEEVLSARRSGVTGSELSQCFERVADACLQFPANNPENKSEPFHFPMVVWGREDEIDKVQFRFKRHSRVWGVDSFPSILESGTYYKPVNPNFPDIDAFGVIDGVLYLFQMKISKAGIKVPPDFRDELVRSFEGIADKESGIENWVFVYVVPFYPGDIDVSDREADFGSVVNEWRKGSSVDKGVFEDVWAVGVELGRGIIDV